MSNVFSAIRRIRLGGTRAFAVVWFGQVISFIGSGMTFFALGVWVYQKTNSITQFALISLLTMLPRVVLGPLVGTLVDRWDRRQAMLLSDVGGGLSILFIILLIMTDRLEFWHIFLSVLLTGACDALRWPALSAATTQLVPKEQFGRASGLLQIVSAGMVLVSPLVAGALLGPIGLQGVILVDFVTFLFALFTLLLIRIPRPAITAEGQAGKGSLLHETVYGWKYITGRTGLLALLVFLSIASFLTEMTYVLFTPMLLSFASTAELGVAMSLGGIGYLAGGVIMSVWGGAKRRINGVIVFMLLMGLFLALIGLRASIPLVTLSLFLCLLCYPITLGSNQAIWQAKVAPDVQGRVFAIRGAITLATPLLADLVTGPLADNVFEPLLAVNGPLAGSVGQIVGVGAGRGSGLLFISAGLFLMLMTAISYLYPRLRLVEDELPDIVTEEPVMVEAGSPVVTVAAN
ncbi:MAG TPA: MFS transporter [Anaerolineae bacterium]|nr:MFS transporter [Anaerolineae bacterium]